MYENISAARLRELKTLIKKLKDTEALIEKTFVANSDSFKSTRL